MQCAYWDKMQAVFLLQYVACTVAYLGYNMDLATHYRRSIGYLTLPSGCM